MKVGQPELARMIWRSVGGPHQLFSIRGKDRENVGGRVICDPDWVSHSPELVAIHFVSEHPEVVVGSLGGIAVIRPGPNNIGLCGVPIGGPIHTINVGEGNVMLAVGSNRMDLQVVRSDTVSAIDNPVAVG